MMTKRFRAFCILSLFSLIWLPALAQADVELVGAGVYSMPSGSFVPESRWGMPGGGLVLDFRMGSKVKFELGGLYLTRFYNAGGVDVKTTMWDGMAGFKIILSRGLYIDLGGYYNSYISNPQGLAGTDAGVLAGLGIKIPLVSSVSLLIHPQYRYALGQLTYSGNTLNPHEIVGMLGLSFGARSSR